MLDGSNPTIEKPLHVQKAELAYGRTGEYDAAAKLLEKWAREDTDLWLALTESILSTTCRNAVRDVGIKRRAEVWDNVPDTPQIPVPQDQQGGRLRTIASKMSLLMFPMLDGKVLGDSTRDDVMAMADWYRRRAKNMAHKAKWLELIAEQLTGKRHVKSCFSEQDLVALRKAAQNG